MVLNWYESVSRNVGLRGHVVVVCLDDDLYKELHHRQIPIIHVNSLFDPSQQDQNVLDADDLKQEQVFGNAKYTRMVNMKIEVAYVLPRYYNIEAMIYTDVDIVWIQPKLLDYFDYLINADQRNYDMLFTTGSGAGFFFPNTGFYVTKKTDFAISYLGKILSSPSKLELHDQDIASIIYHHDLSADERLKLHCLDTVLFVDGATLENPKKYGVKPFLLHANYKMGLSGKKSLLSEAGYWYI